MATGMALSVAQTLVAAIQCQELRELCSYFKYESKLETLRGTVETIQNVLLDAESGQQELNNQGLNWVNKLKDAVYDADDLFDEFVTIAQRQKMMPGGKISKKVRAFFSSENQLLFTVRTSKKIKEIREKLDNVAKDRIQFGFSGVNRPIKRKLDTGSYIHEHSIIGRDADKEVIMGMLRLRESDSSVDNVSFVSIVGMGGLGKTALAQLVYNDVRIKDEFDLKLWVCVSDEFITEQILGKMLKSATQQGHGDIGVDGVQNKVRQHIQGKKYFLVLDDVWSESRIEWLTLRGFLQVGARGSRVVVTTRSIKVAEAVGKDPMHTLKGLKDDDCWHLFEIVAFNQGSGEVDDDLVDIGKNIVKKCANVPLAIRVVGSLLYGEDKSKWQLFQKIKLSEMCQGEESIMPILKFSYHQLKPQLKSCFSYCALFPKDYPIKKELLIRLWSAQGYLDNDMRNREDVGEEYFSILLQRCFLQDIRHDEYGEISSCKMHDLIHDLAQEVAGKEAYLMENTSKGPFVGKSRHLAVFGWSRRALNLNERFTTTSLHASDTFGNLSGLRTYLWNSYSLDCESQLSTILAKCKCLRVLDLHNLRIEALPSTIKNLLHLRYLDLSHNEQLKILPESINRLYNLQVLNLTRCSNLEELPKDMRELVNLRHLGITGCYGLTHMPVGMDSMTGLCTLPRFVLGSENSKKAQIGQLRDLMPLINLRGTLEIIFEDSCAYDSTTGQDEAYLLNKEHIKILGIYENGVRWRDGVAEIIDEKLLERLEPHRDLREMNICGYKGVTLPRWVATLEISFPWLVKITLWGFHDLQHLPALSQLKHLKHLTLVNMHNAESMKNDNNGAPSFPSLETLYLSNCPILKFFPSCPHVKEFDLWRLNEALTFYEQRDVEANAIAASTSRSNDNKSAVGDVFHLRKLKISSFQLLKSLFGESIRSIDKLELRAMEVESLSSVVQEYHHYAFSIDSLVFESCGNLKSLSGGGTLHLTKLKTLSIRNCRKLELEEEKGFPWKHLHALSALILQGLSQMIDIPKGIQYLTSLQSLSIQYCDMKTHPEWVHCPMSLRSLTITNCPKVKTLPEAVLPSLTELYISSCDGLKERYSEPHGTHFFQIRNIPNLYLPHTFFQVATNST